MPSGDAQRIWFPEMLEELKTSWSETMSWDELADFRTRTIEIRMQIREERAIQPPKTRCPRCGKVSRSDISGVSIGSALFALGNRLCRHFLRNLLGHPSRQEEQKIGDTLLPAAPRVRPASATAQHCALYHGSHNDLTPFRMPCVLSPPALGRGLRQNTRPYGYAGVVARHSSAIAPSLPVLLQRHHHRGRAQG